VHSSLAALTLSVGDAGICLSFVIEFSCHN
jgi:hypothetical protein